MGDITVLVPSYGRADRAVRVAENILNNTVSQVNVMFVVEREQFSEYSEALTASPALGNQVSLVGNKLSNSYGGAINTGFKYVSDRYVFLGADDLNFHPEWDIHALNTMEALPHIKVVGTNDLLNTFVLQGVHATHSLIDVDYINNVGGVIDASPGQVLYEGYSHNFVDTEFIGTAKARAVFAPCLQSVVEHLHWTISKSENDATYKKSEDKMQSDADVYYPRRELWWQVSR